MEQKMKVLIADSNEDFRMHISELLRDEGSFEVIGSTGDGTRAVELVMKNLPDVVLTDLILSGADGFALLERASEMPAKTRPKVIVVSNFANNHIVTTAKALGAAYFIQKPCDPTFILNRIKMLIKSYTGSQQTEEYANSMTLRNSSNVERTVTEVMHEIGIPAHIKGYQFLREAILRTVDNRDIINAVTKELYPDVAKRFHTTSSRVEGAIRHAIEVAWNRGDLDVLQKYFGYTVSNAKGKPTNSEFIALIADKLSIERKCCEFGSC